MKVPKDYRNNNISIIPGILTNKERRDNNTGILSLPAMLKMIEQERKKEEIKRSKGEKIDNFIINSIGVTLLILVTLYLFILAMGIIKEIT